MIKILVIEQQEEIRPILKAAFKEVELDVIRSIDLVLEKFAEKTYDVLIWQTSIARKNRNNGNELLEVVSQESPRTQIIIISDANQTEMAIEGIRAGAYQYLVKPIEKQELLSLVRLALQQQPVLGENMLLSAAKRTSFAFEGIYGISPPIQQVIQQIKEAASTDISVLITGETGTGKDLIAHAIHKHSRRKNNPYVIVNTGAMPSELITSELFGYEKGAFTGAAETTMGKFEQANSGTLFLDEIGTMDHKAQVSLLRLLEKQSFTRIGGRKKVVIDVRVIAATNENLENAVKAKKFRDDLYFRFDVFRIDVPPLRKRPGDISLLATHFIHQFNLTYNKSIKRIASGAAHYLEIYPWPGNVRELKNVIQRAVLISKGDELTEDLLPPRITQADTPEMPPASLRVGMKLEEVEKELIGMTLQHYGGNKKKTAEVLGVSRRALYDKLRRYGLG